MTAARITGWRGGPSAWARRSRCLRTLDGNRTERGMVGPVSGRILSGRSSSGMPAKFEASALFEFLGRVDRELAAPSVMFLVGGSAVFDPSTRPIQVLPRLLLGDKAYDSDFLDTELAARGVELIAPNRVTRKHQSQDRRKLR